VALDSAQEAAGQLRYEIEAAFSQGLPNTPMAGSTVRVISGNFITARPVGVVDGVDFKHSGLVRKVDSAGIRRTLDFGAMVLMSPFGFSPTGEAFNLTMEEVATSVAISIQADKLIFLTEIPGIRMDSELPESEDNPIDTELPLDAAEKLLASLPPAQKPDRHRLLPAALREGLQGRRGAQPHPALRARRLAAAGGVRARRRRHHGDRREARGACAKPRWTTSAASCN
jgi:amino-acid N-acetyltransferase